MLLPNNFIPIRLAGKRFVMTVAVANPLIIAPQMNDGLKSLDQYDAKAKEERKRSSKKIRSTWYQLTNPGREKVAWQVISKQVGSYARTKISKRYKGWQQR